MPWLRATLEKENLKNSLNVEVLLSNHEISQHFKPHHAQGNNENDAGLFTSHSDLALMVNTSPMSYLTSCFFFY